MSEVEYVARVIVERVQRRVEPSSIPSRRTSGDQKVVRDKVEIASFSIRGVTLATTVQKINGMVAAALVDGDDVKGEPGVDDEEMEDDE